MEMPDDLVLYFRLEEGSGNPKDSSKYGHEGELVGGIAWDDNGRSGKCLKLDGVDDRLNTPFTIDLTNGYTVLAWFKSDPNQTVYTWGWYSKDYPGDTGDQVVDNSYTVRRGLVASHDPGNLSVRNIGSGWQGPIFISHHSRVDDNTQAVQAWEIRVYEDDILKWSYNMLSNQYSNTTEYHWRESSIWTLDPTKEYEIRVYWPDNVNLYSRYFGIWARRGAVYRPAQFYCILDRSAQAGTRIGFYSFNSVGTRNDHWVGNIIPHDDAWHLVAWVYSGTDKYIYLDGEEKGHWSGLNGINSSSSNLNIGNGYRYWCGWMDEVRVYKKALSGDEIKALYLLGWAKFHTKIDIFPA